MKEIVEKNEALLNYLEQNKVEYDDNWDDVRSGLEAEFSITRHNLRAWFCRLANPNNYNGKYAERMKPFMKPFIGNHKSKDKQLREDRPLTPAESQKLVSLFGPGGLIHIADDRMIKYEKDGVLTNRLEEFLKQFPLSCVNKAKKDDAIPQWLHVKDTGASSTAVRTWKSICKMVKPSSDQIEREMKELGDGGTEEQARQKAERGNANSVVRCALKFSKYYVNPQSSNDYFAKEAEFEALRLLIDGELNQSTFTWEYFTPLARLGDALIEDNPSIDPEDKSLLFDTVADLNKHYKCNDDNDTGPGTLRRKGQRKVDVMHGLYYREPPVTIDWNSYKGKTEEEAKQAWWKTVDWYKKELKKLDKENNSFAQESVIVQI